MKKWPVVMMFLLLSLVMFGCGSSDDKPAAVAPAAEEVTAYSPYSGQLNVPLTTQPSMIFSTALDSSSVNNNTVYLLVGSTADITNTHVAGAPVISGLTVNFVPTASLLANTVYTMVSSGVKSTTGQTSKLHSFTFSTGPAIVTPPVTPLALTVSASLPVPNQTAVALNTCPTVTFSAALDLSTVTSANFRLMDGATQLATVLSTNAPTNDKVTWMSAALVAEKTYTLVVTTDVKDVNGNHLASQYSANFTTVAAPTTPIPPANTHVLKVANSYFYNTLDNSRATSPTVNQINVLLAGQDWQVSRSWQNESIVAGGQYKHTFTCLTTPAKDITVQYKRVSDHAALGSTTVTCNGTVTANITVSVTDAAAELYLNFGAIAGTYTIGDEVTIQKTN